MKIGKENKIDKLELVHTNVWGPAQVSSLEALIIMLHLLMMQLESMDLFP